MGAAGRQRVEAPVMTAPKAVDLVARVGADLRYLYVHPVTAEILGVPRGEIIGRKVGELGVELPWGATWRTAIDEVLRTGEERVLALEVPAPDGSTWHLQTLVMPEIGLDGSVDSVVAVTRDLTRQRELEATLAAQREQIEAKLREVESLHQIAALLQEHRADPHEDMPVIVDLLHGATSSPSDLAVCIEIEGERYSTPGFVLDARASSVPVLLGSTHVGFVAVRALSAAAPDSVLEAERRLLTTVASHLATALRRSQTERDTAAREAYFRALIESSSDAVSVVDAEGTRRYLSPPFRALLGYEPEEVLGQPVLALLHPDDVHKGQEIWRDVLARGHARGEVRMVPRTGQPVYVEVVARNLLDDPAVRGIVSSLRDMTPRRALEHQLRQSQKMEAIGRLAGGVAHDFNNLLTVIEANAEMLLRDLPAIDERCALEAEQILAAARRAATLTRQLLAFSRQQVVQPRVVDLRAVVRGMHAMLRRLIGEDVVLDAQLGEEPLPILADPSGLEQVLLNLAVNAREAMPRGGRLSIRCEASGADGVRLVAADDGEGIDGATIDRVFDPFFTTKTHGTGLGLSTVYAIVEQSGGSVSVESTRGRGAAFTLRFPRAAANTEDARTSADEPGEATIGRETVLVAEDEPAVRRITCEVLRRGGYRVLEAPDGPAALALARAHDGAIDLLLTDVVMPGMSGRELAETLEQERPQLGVLYMSGHTDDARLRHGVREQRVRLVTKPFTGSGLAAAVRRALDER